MPLCKKCKDYTYDENCNCKPYQIYNPETMDEGDFVTIYAKTRDSAANKYTEKEYNYDPCNPEEFNIEFYIGNVKYEGSCEISLIFNTNEV